MIFHTTLDGRVLALSQMDTKHLQNCVDLWLRRNRPRLTWLRTGWALEMSGVLERGGMSSKDATRWANRFARRLPLEILLSCSLPEYGAMRDELTLRAVQASQCPATDPSDPPAQTSFSWHF